MPKILYVKHKDEFKEETVKLIEAKGISIGIASEINLFKKLSRLDRHLSDNPKFDSIKNRAKVYLQKDHSQKQ